jgi:hypothetical protein
MNRTVLGTFREPVRYDKGSFVQEIEILLIVEVLYYIVY